MRLLVVVAGFCAGAMSSCTKPASTPGVASPAPRAAIARFSRIDGTVKVKPVGSVEWVAASLSTSLSRNDLVNTAAGASADILFTDRSVVEVRPDSLITIEGTVEDPATRSPRMAWKISSGEVNLSTQAAKSDTTAVVSTPTSRSYVAGETSAAIRVFKAGETDIRVFKGRSDVETQTGRRVRLQSQEGLRIDAGGEAGGKVALPAKPELLTPVDAADLAYEDPSQAPTLLRWRDQPDAKAYRVVVDSSAFFNEPLFDKQGVLGAQAQALALGAGKFFWKVAAVGAQGLEGGYSDFARFSIVKVNVPTTVPPALSIETLERRGNIVLLKGRTERRSRVTVNGNAIEVRPDGSFSEHLPVDQDRAASFAVRAISPSGGITEQRRNVPVPN